MLVRGVVTYVGNQFGTNPVVYIQDQTAGIAISSTVLPPLALGDEIEVSGDRRDNADHSYIKASAIRWLWSGSDPVPFALRAGQAAGGAFNDRLVQVEGKLVQKTVGNKGVTLAMEGEHQLFAASLSFSSPGSNFILSEIEPGSIVRLTGICSSPMSNLESSPIAFNIILRSLDDIQTVRPPPWLNRRNAMWMSAVLVVVLILLHRLRIHNLRLRFRAVTDERSRLAREIHDTLAQGFSGVALQLEVVVEELYQCHPTPRAQEYLELALRMARHSREEAHNAIFVLRSRSAGRSDLLSTLVKSAELRVTDHSLKIRSHQTGDPFMVGDDVEHDLLRIGQEAISNAIHHANATCIEIVVSYRSSELELLVVDNGEGFEIMEAKSTSSGHFGLTGMRERASGIGAQFELISSPDSGTRVRLTVPRIKVPFRSFYLTNLKRFLAHD